MTRPVHLSLAQPRRKLAVAAVATAVGLGALALYNVRQARKAEAEHPPAGGFLHVDGVRLHYVERGRGPAVVLIHGNGGMVPDFLSSGLVGLLAARHRVIVFDRPGYGHSARPKTKIWTAKAQAALINAGLDQLGVNRAIVLGHSWGALVAVALGLAEPKRVTALVLASGFYFPGEQPGLIAGSLLMAGPALPLVGPVIGHTVAPVLGRLAWTRMISRLFAPLPVPAKFSGFPREMALRPSHIAASAAEAGLLGFVAAGLQAKYGTLTMPVAIVAGTDDRLVDSVAQSGRLQRVIGQSVMHWVPGAGHMVHQSAPERIDGILRLVAAMADDAALRPDTAVGDVTSLVS